ncbi:hypothetical protein KSP40_PGU003652 [Platanthera guangdongensis]|uniref:Myosin motor domain-containing protein n=1 Tax=Platanthera guangdongensis TaxID=2320717 RepID=A0ABR2MSX0_9ASPA
MRFQPRSGRHLAAAAENIVAVLDVETQTRLHSLQVKDKYKLTSPQSFHYLNQSDCYELDGVDDSLEYLATIRAMDIVGINESEQEAIFRVVAAILHLGNIDFAKGEEIDSSVIKNDKSRFHLKTAAELLMCDAQGLEDALIKRVMVTPEEIITRTLDPLAMTLCHVRRMTVKIMSNVIKYFDDIIY